ncbi:MAG: DUF3800 domain-containing protein [Alphaproteobacteria bacterium]|nr:DUF3800 domain-containing protein [Alphaproteobacteria bacterium]
MLNRGQYTCFLFIDESIIELNRNKKLYTYNAIKVPVSVYSELRSNLYNSISKVLGHNNQNEIRAIPELHYNDFLPEENDDIKFSVMSEIVNAIIKYDIKIYRVGYYRTKETEKIVFKDNIDSQFYSLCWFGIQSVTTEIRKENLLIPVVDAGFNGSFQSRVDGFGHPQKLVDQMWEKHSEGISLGYADNIAETSFVDSKFSIFVQAADCITGLRNTIIQNSNNTEISEYKKQMGDISQLLDDGNVIAHEEHITLKQG